MPMAFAVKMWNWTKMGARVLVTPGEMSPAKFSHPFLVTQKVVPQPLAEEAPQVDAPLGVKSDKGADAAREVGKSIDTADVKLDLRSTVGHARLHTADASGVLPANAAVTMSDAAPAAASGEAAPVKAADSADKAETAKTQAAKAMAETATPNNNAVEDKPAEIATGTIKTEPSEAKPEATAEAAVKAEDKTVEPKADAKADAKVEAAKTEAPKTEPVKAEEPKSAEKPVEKPAEKAAGKPAETPAEPAKAVTEAPAKKDPSRLPGVAEKAKPDLKREGQVAVFISRKDGKLYVRQNFKPVFDVPVTISGNQMMGTHVFTAEVDKTDTNLLRWSVVSLPVTARNAQRNDDTGRATRRGKVAGAVPAETKTAPAPNTPAEALDRITVPPEVMAKIAEALTSGGSIVVSDQGINQGETGEGTDFIVRLR
jgi:hypothetical protein